jgi:Family of unknown function (DUF6504)
MVRRYEESIEVRAGEGAVGFNRLATVSRDMATVLPDLATSPREVSTGAQDLPGDEGRDGRVVDGLVVDDRVVDGLDAQGPSPSAFLWRGRLYIVRDVIGHWRERRAWWRDALDPDEQVAPQVCLEQEVWRVEASPGRLAGTGVYDLAMSGRTWRLLRVAD